MDPTYDQEVDVSKCRDYRESVATEYNPSSSSTYAQIQMISKVAPESYDAMEHGREAHWEVVERILFLYAKLNPGIGYVQGMNEIIGPIYFIMASDSNNEYRGEFCQQGWPQTLH